MLATVLAACCRGYDLCDKVDAAVRVGVLSTCAGSKVRLAMGYKGNGCVVDYKGDV